MSHVQNELTMGQVYVLLDSMADYLRLINGAKDEEEDDGIVRPDAVARETIGKNDDGAIPLFVQRGVAFPKLDVVRFEDLPQSDQELLADLHRQIKGDPVE